MNDCNTCKHYSKEWDELPCDYCCSEHSGYERRNMQELLKAIQVINAFLDSCKDVGTCLIIAPDGTRLDTDWGYFEEGLREIENYAMGKHES